MFRPGDPRGIHLLAGVLLLTPLVGCGSTHCLAPGECVKLPSNAWFFACLWVSQGLVFMAVLGLATGVIQLWSKPTSAVTSLSIAVCIGVFACMVFPGGRAPSVITLEQAREAYEHRRLQALPSTQIAEAQQTVRKLTEHLSQRLQPLQIRYANELWTYEKRLQKELPRAGLRSHEELLARQNEHLELANVLHRAAVLTHAIKLLDQQVVETTRTRQKLEQQMWLLEKGMELDGVRTLPRSDEVRHVLAVAQALLELGITPLERQDVAGLEADIFRQLLMGGVP